MAFKFIRSADTCVNDFFHGFSGFSHGIKQVKNRSIIFRNDLDKKKVMLVSGGGSGHEPAHAGYVGKGMLTAAVAGNVFTSPPPNLILEAIYQIGKESDNGVLLIVKNYTGDRINFSIAAERAKRLGISVETIVVGDDTALSSVNKAVGRRGLAGTILVHKIAGALSEKNFSLAEIKTYLNHLLEPGVMGTIGLSFSGCTPPGTNTPTFDIPVGMYELGLGIHGEAGVRKERFIDVNDCLKVMLNQLTKIGIGKVQPDQGSDVVVLVNNLGSVTDLEMFSVAKFVINYVESELNVRVVRGFCGKYMTSLEMYGISITLLKVMDKSLLEYLDYPTDAPAWNNCIYKFSDKSENEIESLVLNADFLLESQTVTTEKKLTALQQDLLFNVIQSICEILIQNEDHLNNLDRETGDFDCGTTFKRGAKALKNFLSNSSNKESFEFISRILSRISVILESEMGGSSGGLLSLYFETLATLKRKHPESDWCDIFLDSTKHISTVGGAFEGDRTMLDVLFPVFREWQNVKDLTIKDIFKNLSTVAEDSAKATQFMKPKAGRASYVVDDVSILKGPDPGAEAMSLIFKAIHTKLN